MSYIRPLYVPLSPLDSGAVARERLRVWHPLEEPFDKYWLVGQGTAISTDWAPTIEQPGRGEDNSYRVSQPRGGRVVTYPFNQWEPFTWAYWMKPYDVIETGHPINPVVSGLYYGTYWTFSGYSCNPSNINGLWFLAGSLLFGTHIYEPLNNYRTGGGSYVNPGVWQHQITSVYTDGTNWVATIYQDGRPTLSGAVSGGHIGISDQYLILGHNDLGGWTSSNLAIKDFRAYYGTVTAEEALSIYEQSLAYFKANSSLVRQKYFLVTPPQASEIPDHYAPNLELSWVQKADHIWALHPDHPLKDDIGGNDLIHLSGTETVRPDNWVEVSGTRWQSAAAFRFGENPDPTKTIGAVALWWDRGADGPYHGLVSSGHYYNDFSIMDYSGTGNGLDYVVQIAAQTGVRFGVESPLNVPQHLVWQLKADGATELWVNGVKQTDFTANLIQAALGVFPFEIGFAQGATDQFFAAGAIRQVAVINGDTWTPAEIAFQAANPYAYYAEVFFEEIPLAGVITTAAAKGIAAAAAGQVSGGLAGVQAVAAARGIGAAVTGTAALGLSGVVGAGAALGIAATASGVGLMGLSTAPTVALVRGITGAGVGLVTGEALAGVEAETVVGGIGTRSLGDVSFHAALDRIIAAGIERERITLLGRSSYIDIYEIEAGGWVNPLRLADYWVARRFRLDGAPDEWWLEIPEIVMAGPVEIGREITFEMVRSWAGCKINTHGQDLTFSITQTQRPVKAGHLWKFRLEALGDKE